MRRANAVLCSFAALAGCGGDEDDGDAATTVTQTVTTPKPDTTVAVPDVVGEDLQGAREALADAGLRAQARRKASDRPAGQVLRQDPRGGVRIEKRAVVELVVAKERPVETVECGNLVESGAGTYNVHATGLDCETAIVVARQWEQECATQPDGSCEVTLGFACAYRQVAHELGEIACVKGARRVSFETGA
jgi:hypothetical protein